MEILEAITELHPHYDPDLVDALERRIDTLGDTDDQNLA